MKSINRRQPSGMLGFSIIWFGQLVSLTGSGMTVFALTLWAWQATGSATALALMGFFFMGPTVLVSPIAGALVDRWSRKFVMILTDTVSGVATLAVLLLYLSGNLQIWHLYAVAAVVGAFQAFQWPAYSATISVMVDKKHYGRANGMMSLAESASAIAAPILAGFLIGVIGIAGVMTVDLITFFFAVGTLSIVHIPQPPKVTASPDLHKSSLLQESLYGFRYILQRPSLLGLQLTLMATNLLAAFAYGVMSPMILARSENNAQVLGTVLSISGVGGVIGGLAMSVWGGPKRRVHGLLGGLALESLLGVTLLGLGRSLPVWAVAAFCSALLIPIINGSNQAIWQSKVAPDVQGRVFAVRRLIAQMTSPLGVLIAGPLADFVFEPAMRTHSALRDFFGGLVGVGPGAGMALMFVFAGVLGVAVGLSGYLFKAVRDAESILPDHDERT
ncbi:Enterobactin exporter EntS [bacterium HR07]|nr:Enterobactin exporter EntS [bacterium HR07]